MSVSANEKKKRAALAALSYVREGIVVGVGTGSTVNHFIDALIASGGACRAVRCRAPTPPPPACAPVASR